MCVFVGMQEPQLPSVHVCIQRDVLYRSSGRLKMANATIDKEKVMGVWKHFGLLRSRNKEGEK